MVLIYSSIYVVESVFYSSVLMVHFYVLLFFGLPTGGGCGIAKFAKLC